MSSRHFNHGPVSIHREGRASARPLTSPQVHSSHRSGIGPARNVPAPPSARGVQTREGRNLLRPTWATTRSTPASGRLTRSTQRHKDTEVF